MLLTDSHIHTNLSPDGHSSMHAMSAASAEAGVGIVCFTDHCDMVDWTHYAPSDGCLDMMPELIRQHSQLPDDLPIDVRVGIELGEAQLNRSPLDAVLQYPLDFVLGSLHVLRNFGDLYYIQYENLAHCRRVMSAYLDELIEVAELDFFDVMAHIGYPKRGMRKYGCDYRLTPENGGDKLRHLLKLLIQNGRGIEINCSGIRDHCGPFPDLDVLRLYRELGGEIVTTGSDAHKTADAGKCLRDGAAVLKEAGFKYITVFKDRKPEFIKLD